MSQVTRLLNELKQELALNGVPSVKELVDQLHSLIDVLPVATLLKPIQDYHLLQGLLHAGAEMQFFDRLQDAAEEKAKLAKYSYEKCGLKAVVAEFRDQRKPHVQRLFFESGSTIAHVIGVFAEHLFDTQQIVARSLAGKNGTSESRLPVKIVTNNLTGVTALAGLADDVEPVQGRLSLKYFGFFPFGDDDNSVDIGTEARRYNLLVRDVEQSDVIFATCSNFSFLAGPLVGTRGNCLFKRAMYDAALGWDGVPARKFYLMFHFSKVVPVINSYGPFEFDQPKESCGCVFGATLSDVNTAIDTWLDSADAKDPVGRAPFRKSWHNRYSELLASGAREYVHLSIPADDFSRKAAASRAKLLPHPNGGWIDWVMTANGASLLVSLPNENIEDAVAVLKEEIQRVNEIFQHARLVKRYRIINESTAVDDGVVEIDVCQTS